MQEQQHLNIYIASLGLLITFIVFIVIYVVVHRQRQNQLHLEKDHLAAEYRNKLLTAAIKEQERVLNRLSRELHDNLGQSLSFVKMSLSVITRQAAATVDTKLMNDTHRMLDTVISETHNISHVLNSNYIEKQGLAQLLQLELDHMQTYLSIDGILNQTGGIRIKDPEKELLIYRIAQEVLHNIIKHAHATNVSISLSYEATFQMVITDDGIGFDTQKDTKGIGLQNMMDRAQLLKGQLTINAVPGSGTVISLMIPSVNNTAGHGVVL